MNQNFFVGNAFNTEQGHRIRKLFAAVVLKALDDAISDELRFGNGTERIARWARTHDGRQVLFWAGVDPNERVVARLIEYVSRRVPTSVALSRNQKTKLADVQAA